MASENAASAAPTFESSVDWTPNRPKILVIACSDGRLQQALDDFLDRHLGIRDYDRLFVPGGPGAFTADGMEPVRAAQMLQELKFLVRVHGVRQIVLIFHSAAEGGPEDAVCGDYRRVRPTSSQREVSSQQVSDLRDVLQIIHSKLPGLAIHSYRAEVTYQHRVRFIDLKES